MGRLVQIVTQQRRLLIGIAPPSDNLGCPQPAPQNWKILFKRGPKRIGMAIAVRVIHRKLAKHSPVPLSAGVR